MVNDSRLLGNGSRPYSPGRKAHEENSGYENKLADGFTSHINRASYIEHLADLKKEILACYEDVL